MLLYESTKAGFLEDVLTDELVPEIKRGSVGGPESALTTSREQYADAATFRSEGGGSSAFAYGERIETRGVNEAAVKADDPSTAAIDTEKEVTLDYGHEEVTLVASSHISRDVARLSLETSLLRVRNQTGRGPRVRTASARLGRPGTLAERRSLSRGSRDHCRGYAHQFPVSSQGATASVSPPRLGALCTGLHHEHRLSQPPSAGWP